MARRRRPRRRKRVGRVSYYFHHGSWYLYFRDGVRPVRRRVAGTEDAAERAAAQVNAQLATSSPTPFSFTPVSVADLRRRFLEHHEDVLRSSLATVRRYRAATQHLENFAQASGGSQPAHELNAERFVAWLRRLRVSPNGHANTAQRQLRDKGLRFILEVCRSLYSFAAKRRHPPPYAENPFSLIDIERIRIEDAKPVFVFDAETELRFLEQADPWTFAIQFTLAKTGLRSGELIHLLIEDVDLEAGWLQIRNKPELGWRVKTGRERCVPLIEEAATVLQRVIGARDSGPVFVRHQFEPQNPPLANCDRTALRLALDQRIKAAEASADRPLARECLLKIAATIWRDAGAIRADLTRRTFIRTAATAGLPDATCPKSWRHTFATLMQDANVDPLIRQVTLGHKPTDSARGGLGMTGVYTHTRAETQKREIERALRLWPRSLDYARRWSEQSRDAPH